MKRERETKRKSKRRVCNFMRIFFKFCNIFLDFFLQLWFSNSFELKLVTVLTRVVFAPSRQDARLW